jgi:uncharacterized membrane protein YfcA
MKLEDETYLSNKNFLAEHTIIMDKKLKYLIFFLLSAVVGVINGFFGGGGGMLCVPIFKKFLNLPDKQSHATTVCVMSIVCLPTLIVYLLTLNYTYSQLIFATIGSVAGGIVGAKIMTKISDKTLNLLFVIVLFLSGIKMLF